MNDTVSFFMYYLLCKFLQAYRRVDLFGVSGAVCALSELPIWDNVAVSTS
jgi:hypothetical protein